MADFYLVISNPDVDEEGLEEDVLRFADELRQQPEVIDIDTVRETDVPDGAKGLGSAIMGFLTMEITIEGVKALLPKLPEMAKGRTIKVMRKKANGSEISVEVSSRKDLDAVKEFLDSLG